MLLVGWPIDPVRERRLTELFQEINNQQHESINPLKYFQNPNVKADMMIKSRVGVSKETTVDKVLLTNVLDATSSSERRMKD